MRTVLEDVPLDTSPYIFQYQISSEDNSRANDTSSASQFLHSSGTRIDLTTAHYCELQTNRLTTALPLFDWPRLDHDVIEYNARPKSSLLHTVFFLLSDSIFVQEFFCCIRDWTFTFVQRIKCAAKREAF